MTTYPYQDSALSAMDRSKDLLARLSLEEKAGLMFQVLILPSPIDYSPPQFPLPTTREHLDKEFNQFALIGHPPTIEKWVEWHNDLQKVALAKRWGIPITLSSDPRHSFVDNVNTGSSTGLFSQWPEQIGMVALHDEERVREWGDIIRQEYVAVGLRASLHPQADLATEYRWSRIAGSMGEDADLASKLTAIYIKAMHGDTFGPTSVSTCVKHFPGGGPQEGGLDPHFEFGKDQIYPGSQFDYHLKPFQAAIEAGVRTVMPSYGIPKGLNYKEVAMAYNKEIVDDLLRGQCGFKGLVLTDFGIIEDKTGALAEIAGDLAKGRCWGVEHLTVPERVLMLLEAGTDVFGGDTCVGVLKELVKEGKVPESRLDKSVLPILEEKFSLGLFDKPLVDLDNALKVVGNPKFLEAGKLAQKDSLTLLTNVGGSILPLTKKTTKLYTEGFTQQAPGDEYAITVTSPSEADAIVVRLKAPFEPMGTGAFSSDFHHGSIEFSSEVLTHVKELSKHAPVVVVIFSDRPSVLGSLLEDASAILLDYGCADALLTEVLFGESSPKGKLPFDMPKSLKAVEEACSDKAFDTVDPNFRFGHGLRYEAAL